VSKLKRSNDFFVHCVLILREIALHDCVDQSALASPCHRPHQVPRFLGEAPRRTIRSRFLASDVKVATMRQSVYCGQGRRIFKRLYEVRILAGVLRQSGIILGRA
jgi:hypothetical protein